MRRRRRVRWLADCGYSRRSLPLGRSGRRRSTWLRRSIAHSLRSDACSCMWDVTVCSRGGLHVRRSMSGAESQPDRRSAVAHSSATKHRASDADNSRTSPTRHADTSMPSMAFANLRVRITFKIDHPGCNCCAPSAKEWRGSDNGAAGPACTRHPQKAYEADPCNVLDTNAFL
jgi:hypothetical protein